MAIMATDMALNHKYRYLLLSTLLVGPVYAGEVTITPSLAFKGSYTDNVELSALNKKSSFVSQITPTLYSDYVSRIAEFRLNATATYATYSHNHDLDDDYRTLELQGRYKLWPNGIALIGSANISNVSRNGADNSLADLVSADTVEYSNYAAGVQYQVDNPTFAINTSILYSIAESDDRIGEYDETSLALVSQNKPGKTLLFWQLDGKYSERKNNDIKRETYLFEALAGIYSSNYLIPYVRFFDENSKGDSSLNSNNMSSIGPGLRWKASSHLHLDLSYNFSDKKRITDDYVAASINWQPSNRTSLTAGYSQRFYGDSYKFEFNHKMRRLTNTIKYDETVQAFDRNSFETVLEGNFLCPTVSPADLTNCTIADEQADNIAGSIFIPVFSLQLVEGSQFVLTKSLNWESQLKLSRTTFKLSILDTEIENLSSGRLDNNVKVKLSTVRKISAKTNLELTGSFAKREFDNNSADLPEQNDHYRTVTLALDRKLSSDVETTFNIQYLDRNSSAFGRTYEEMRLVFNINKEF